MSLESLSPEQQEAFKDRLKELRMDPAKVLSEISPDTHQGPIVLSIDPDRSHVPPHHVTVDSIDEVKRIAGNPDADFESGKMQEHHQIPPDCPSEILAADPGTLNADQNAMVDLAERAYIYGNSARVTSWREAIDRHRFPVTFAVFAAESVCLDSSNSPLIIDSHSAHNFGTLKVCKGGWIQVAENGTMTIQNFVRCEGSDCSSC